MAALGGGLVALVLGIIGIIYWRGEFISLLKAALPVMLIMGGALAAYLGYEEIKEKDGAETSGDTADDLKHEVETLKEEIKVLKEDKETDNGN